MAWTTPKTWASGYVVLASDLNTYLRDQQLETAPATVSAQGDIVYASGANALARLAKDANATRSLTNTGGSNNPAWAQVALATGVSGQLPVGSGGTGANTLTANGVLVGNGSSAIAVTATMETKGHLLAGDGSGAPSMLGVGDDDQVLTADSGEATGLKWASTTSEGAAKAWLDVDQTGTQTIRDSLNVASISDQGAGLTQVNFTTPFANTNYCIVFGGADGVTNDASGNSVRVNAGKGTAAYTMGSAIENQSSGVSSYADAESLSAACFGDQ